MSTEELLCRMTELIKQQADIIQAQSDALRQVHAAVDLEDRIAQADRERQEIL